MNWYTKENGVLCLGIIKGQFAHFNITTNVIVKSKIQIPLSESDVALIGSFPEDWSSDNKIENKINNVAKHLFGLSNNNKPMTLA